MFTINVLTRVLTVWFCLNKVGFSLPKFEQVRLLDNAARQNVGDQNVLKTSNHSDLTEETIGSRRLRRRVKFTKRITQRLGIFDKLLKKTESREGLV